MKERVHVLASDWLRGKKMMSFSDGRCISVPIHTQGRELCRDPGSLQDERKRGSWIDGTDKKEKMRWAENLKDHCLQREDDVRQKTYYTVKWMRKRGRERGDAGGMGTTQASKPIKDVFPCSPNSNTKKDSWHMFLDTFWFRAFGSVSWAFWGVRCCQRLQTWGNMGGGNPLLFCPIVSHVHIH